MEANSLSDFYTITEITELNKQMARFKYSCCALYGEKIAFGGQAGSVHIYSSKDFSSPFITSIPTIITSVQLISFSPGGKCLAVGGTSSVHFIEDPLTSPVVSYSVDLKSKKPVAVYWISDPPAKLNRTPFLLVGDETGGVWSVRHQTAELIGSVNSQIIQLQQISEETILIAAVNGSSFLKNGTVSNIRGKRPAGEFGAIYSKTFNAILLSRPDGTIYITSPEGKPQAKINLWEKREVPALEGISKDLRYLVQCSNFLVSAGKNAISYFINLSNVSLQEYMVPDSEFIDLSCYKNNCLLMWKTKFLLFHVCTNNAEYFNYLIEKKEYRKAQEIAIEKNVKDMKLLEKMNIDSSEDFIKYMHKVELESQPQPIKTVKPELYESIVNSDIPSQEDMDKMQEMLKLLIPEEEVVEKIRKFIKENPKQWSSWEKFLDIDDLVAAINPNPENASITKEIAKKGTSQLSKWIANVENVELSVLVANSPAIYLHNIDDNRKEEYLRMLKEADIFSSNEPDEAEEPLIISPFEQQRSKITEENCSPESVLSLLRLSDWESHLANAIDELCKQTETYLLSKDRGNIPPWIEELAKNESAGLPLNPQENKDAGGNWGVIADLSICPICGLPIQLTEASSSASAFPCGHTYHVGCIKTRYCPLCFTECLK